MVTQLNQEEEQGNHKVNQQENRQGNLNLEVISLKIAPTPSPDVKIT